ncbi:Uncharacterised protein [Serratia fonticola]|uniref:Uncharacterized protein n=1 Tax=Serratia fonticola TaxID=47917 RepID=A0A4V6KT67_SERFO|nr:Uncharacterised protein [Serratia fonticola]
MAGTTISSDRNISATLNQRFIGGKYSQRVAKPNKQHGYSEKPEKYLHIQISRSMISAARILRATPVNVGLTTPEAGITPVVARNRLL